MHLPYSLKWKLSRRLLDGVPAARWMGVTVGRGCRIYSGAFSTEPWLVTIGDRVTVSVDVKFLPHDGVGWLFEGDGGRHYRYGPITVGSDVFIGAGAILLPGVSIGDRCVIGAGSVVTKSIPSGSVVYGDPATVRATYEGLETAVRESWRTEAEMRGKGRRERIDSILEATPRPLMPWPPQVDPPSPPRASAPESGNGNGRPVPTVEFLGLLVADVRRADLVESLATLALSRREEPAFAFALHVGGLLSLDDQEFVRSMSEAEIVYADGVSAQLLARLAGAKEIERSVTTDVGWELLRALEEKTGRPPRVALIGGPPGLATDAMEELVAAGAAEAAFDTHGFHEDWAPIIEEVRAADPDVIFVGLGAPMEMVWVAEHEGRLPPALVLTCGGWFGYIVGDEPRAPTWMRRFALEWLHRLALQPRRLAKRYLRGAQHYPGLAIRVLGERLSGPRRRPPSEFKR